MRAPSWPGKSSAKSAVLRPRITRNSRSRLAFTANPQIVNRGGQVQSGWRCSSGSDLDRGLCRPSFPARRQAKEEVMAISRRVLVSSGLAGLAVLAAGPTFAHHGWAWTQDGFFELKGIIKEIYIGN